MQRPMVIFDQDLREKMAENCKENNIQDEWINKYVHSIHHLRRIQKDYMEQRQYRLTSDNCEAFACEYMENVGDGLQVLLWKYVHESWKTWDKNNRFWRLLRYRLKQYKCLSTLLSYDTSIDDDKTHQIMQQIESYLKDENSLNDDFTSKFCEYMQETNTKYPFLVQTEKIASSETPRTDKMITLLTHCFRQPKL